MCFLVWFNNIDLLTKTCKMFAFKMSSSNRFKSDGLQERNTFFVFMEILLFLFLPCSSNINTDVFLIFGRSGDGKQQHYFYFQRAGDELQWWGHCGVRQSDVTGQRRGDGGTVQLPGSGGIERWQHSEWTQIYRKHIAAGQKRDQPFTEASARTGSDQWLVLAEIKNCQNTTGQELTISTLDLILFWLLIGSSIALIATRMLFHEKCYAFVDLRIYTVLLLNGFESQEHWPLMLRFQTISVQKPKNEWLGATVSQILAKYDNNRARESTNKAPRTKAGWRFLSAFSETQWLNSTSL